MLRALLASDPAVVNAVDECDCTPLRAAAAAGRVGAMHVLIAAGADLYLSNRRGYTLRSLVRSHDTAMRPAIVSRIDSYCCGVGWVG